MIRGIFLCGLLAVGCGEATPQPPIYLGHVATTTGPERQVGQQEAWGIRLAAEDWAKDKTLILERSVHVKHTDARGDLEAFESQAVRLVSFSRVIALYGGSTPEEAIRLDRAAAPLLTPLRLKPRGVSERAFTVGMMPRQQGKALAQFALAEKKVKRAMVLVDERREASQQVAEALEREFATADGARLDKFAFAKDTSLLKLDEKFAAQEAIFFAGTANDFLELQKTFPEAPLVFFAGDDGALPKDLGKQPIYFATAFIPEPDRPPALEFVKRFRAAFQEPPDVHAALAYDGVRLFVDALRRAQPQVAEHFLDELRKTKDFAGLTGPLSFGKDQGLRRPLFVAKSEGGVVASLKRYEPSE